MKCIFLLLLFTTFALASDNIIKLTLNQHDVHTGVISAYGPSVVDIISEKSVDVLTT